MVGTIYLMSSGADVSHKMVVTEFQALRQLLKLLYLNKIKSGVVL